MKIKTEIIITRRTADGDEVLRSAAEDVQIVGGNAEGFRSMADLASPHAESCIYCDSTGKRTSEHVLPYAWGGIVQIHGGSCEECQRITQAFEGQALNDGAMAHVRKALGLQSRTRHRKVVSPVETRIVGADGQPLAPVEGVEPPIIMGLPLFSKPGLISGDGTRVELEFQGMGAVAFGGDLTEFFDGQSEVVVTQQESGKRIMAFARTIAKIAYGWAWRDGVIQRLGGAPALVNAFMHKPEKLGAFLGAKPQPYERFPGMTMRIEYKLSMPRQLVYLEVQMFAETGAPTYEVVLGQVADMRAWRKLQPSFANFAGPSVGG